MLKACIPAIGSLKTLIFGFLAVFAEDSDFQSMGSRRVDWLGAYYAAVCVCFRSTFWKMSSHLSKCCICNRDSSFLPVSLSLAPVHGLESRFSQLYGHDQCKFRMLEACILTTSSLKTLIFKWAFWSIVLGFLKKVCRSIMQLFACFLDRELKNAIPYLQLLHLRPRFCLFVLISLSHRSVSRFG